MRKPLAIALFAAFALASCGGGGGPGDQAAPVAGAKAPAGKQWTEVVAATAEGYRMGNPDAPLKLVEYGSRTCPTCANFAREGTKPLEEKYIKTGKVSYEFREFFVHGAPDVPASALGHCVGPDAFFPILEQMYVNQDAYLAPLQASESDQAFQASVQTMTPTQAAAAWAEKMGLIEFFKQRGLPEDRARACLNDQKLLEKLAKVTNDANTSGVVTGTPTFLLNGKKLDSVLDWKGVEAALKSAGGG